MDLLGFLRFLVAVFSLAHSRLFLVVLDRDPYAISPAELLDVNVVGTMVGGLWRHGGL